MLEQIVIRIEIAILQLNITPFIVKIKVHNLI
jgi:hypothetical protein